MALMKRKHIFNIAAAIDTVVIAGLLLPESLVIPVAGATKADWSCWPISDMEGIADDI